MPDARKLYSAAWRPALGLAFGHLLWRSLKQPAYRSHWGERLGHAQPRSGTRPVWVHAVSVGETRAAVPMIRDLAQRFPEMRFLLTHTTPTGRETGALELGRVLGERLEQCYLPYDVPFAVERFLDRWKPACGLIMETEVWPNLVAAAKARGIAMALVNARLSARSLKKALRFRRVIGPAFAALDFVAAQSQADADRIARLGRKVDLVSGNMKFDQEVSRVAYAVGQHWRSFIGRRKVVVAASTREGEERLILERWSLQVLAGNLRPDKALDNVRSLPLLVIVPRHPQRFDAVGAMLADYVAAPNRARRSEIDEEKTPADALADCAILLGDSMGEMQQWYALADVAIMGGSLLPFGSQNLIEANAMGCPVVLGPSIFNFAEAAAEAIAAGSAKQVADTDAAVATALRIATNDALHAEMKEKGVAFANAHRGASARTVAAVMPLLVPRSSAAASAVAARQAEPVS